jgi:tripartite-type tricarboxylate transporter receptor subunit TctC
MVRALNAPDVREQVAASGAEVAAGTPEDFAAIIRSETAKWGKIIKDAGIKAQ